MTYQASGTAVPVPAELSALLSASSDPDRERAWAGFVHAFTPAMLRVARSLGGDADLVMDRYTFVLERLRGDDYRRLRAYARPGAGEFSLWLIVVVRRLCLDHHRERYGRTRGNPDDKAGMRRAQRLRLADLLAEHTSPEFLAASPGSGPDELLAHKEQMTALGAALGRLSAEDRLLLRLRFGEELSAREIGTLMHFPTLFHVYRRLDRVLKELRASLLTLGVRDPEP